jgi:hypothetical protein
LKGAGLLCSPTHSDQRSEETKERRPKNIQIWLQRSRKSLQTMGKKPKLKLPLLFIGRR